jgi:fucose 4-O-acetylase-like acetyltransferase
MDKRIEWIDLSKGIGMVLVILGHCVCFGGNIHNIVFSFHMPLFFILSGIVFGNNQKNFVLKKAKALLVPYVYFCLVGLIVSLIIPTWREKLSLYGIIQDIYIWETQIVSMYLVSGS